MHLTIIFVPNAPAPTANAVANVVMPPKNIDNCSPDSSLSLFETIIPSHAWYTEKVANPAPNVTAATATADALTTSFSNKVF